ncbi:MAG: LysR substrate-binding domain-containing protein [Acidiferrobacterales bacterium]
MAALQQKHPYIHIEIVISNEVCGLGKREADIALRMFRPQQPDLVTRRLPDMALGVFAHRDYIRRRGTPADLAEIRHHNIIGFDKVMDFINGAAHLGYTIARKDFTLHTDNLLAQIALLRSGAGIGVTHLGLARRYAELVPVLEDLSLPSLEFWCACHRDMQYNARMRAVMQHLGGWLADDPYSRALVQFRHGDCPNKWRSRREDARTTEVCGNIPLGKRAGRE